jgi:hypothetical protein
VVVRAEKGSSPVLVPTNQGRRDAAVFRLEAGELTLDGLGFLLQPNGTDGTTAVVNVSGGRRCDVRNCVITLDEDADESAAAVAVSDVTEQMKSDTVVRPAIGFENCLVRGRGRLVRAGTTVPMDVTVTNVGAAVNGPLFEFGTPGHTSPGGGVSVNLTQLTAVLGGPLLDVRSGRRSVDDKLMMVPVDVRADGCLFLPLESGTHPLVHLTGGDPGGSERPLAWTAGAVGNGFSGWDVYAEVPNPENGGEPKRWDAADWRRWSGERDTAIGRAALTKPPTARELLTVQPADLEPGTTPFASGIGVKAKLLPKADE